jgi:hypothetical protein
MAKKCGIPVDKSLSADAICSALRERVRRYRASQGRVSDVLYEAYRKCGGGLWIATHPLSSAFDDLLSLPVAAKLLPVPEFVRADGWDFNPLPLTVDSGRHLIASSGLPYYAYLDYLRALIARCRAESKRSLNRNRHFDFGKEGPYRRVEVLKDFERLVFCSSYILAPRLHADLSGFINRYRPKIRTLVQLKRFRKRLASELNENRNPRDHFDSVNLPLPSGVEQWARLIPQDAAGRPFLPVEYFTNLYAAGKKEKKKWRRMILAPEDVPGRVSEDRTDRVSFYLAFCGKNKNELPENTSAKMRMLVSRIREALQGREDRGGEEEAEDEEFLRSFSLSVREAAVNIL